MTDTNTEPKPIYLINLAAAPTMWDPEPWQIQKFPNPSYLNSLWIGLVWNLFLLPTRLWHEVIDTLLDGQILGALLLLVALPISMVRLAWLGLTCQAFGVRLGIDIVLSARFMTPREAYDDLKQGPGVLLRAN